MRSIDKRLIEHKTVPSSNKRMREDMNRSDDFKYFKIEPLFETDDLNILQQKENEYIGFYDTYLNGYNKSMSRHGVTNIDRKLPNVLNIVPHKLQTIEQRQIGVCKHNNSNMFVSKFRKKGLIIRLGYYEIEQEARIAYDIAICSFFNKDEIRYLNFPEYFELYKSLKIDIEKDLPLECKKALRLFFNHSEKEMAVL